MSSFWLAPLLLALLSLAWSAVQRAWIAAMDQPGDADALQRPGLCAGGCACRADCERRRQAQGEPAGQGNPGDDRLLRDRDDKQQDRSHGCAGEKRA